MGKKKEYKKDYLLEPLASTTSTYDYSQHLAEGEAGH